MKMLLGKWLLAWGIEFGTMQKLCLSSNKTNKGLT